MSIASEIQRIQTAKANIKAALESKGITVPSTLKIGGYAQLIESIVPDLRVVAKFNVTDTSNPTQIIGEEGEPVFSAIEIDDVVQQSVVSTYTFSTTGEHTVKYTLTDPTSIGSNAFGYCIDLTSVTIPNTVTSIGEEAFYLCVSLTNVTIGNNVTSIDNYAFEDCSSLTSINIPDSITSIGSNAFYGCNELNAESRNAINNINPNAFGEDYDEDEEE